MIRAESESEETIERMEDEESRHTPEGESASRPLRRRETTVLLVVGAIGALAVGITAYFIGGLSAIGVAIGLVVVYALVGAMPAIGGVISRARQDEEIHNRVEKRIDEDERAEQT